MTGARGRLHKTTNSSNPRRSARRDLSSSRNDDIPTVFQELLDEVEESDRPRKKRKTAPARTAKNPDLQPGSLEASTLTGRPSTTVSLSQTSHTITPEGQSLSVLHAPSTVTQTVTDNGMHTPHRMRQTIIDSDESDGSDEEWEDALDNGQDNDGGEGSREVPPVGDISITFGGQSSNTETRRKVRRRAITSVDKNRRLDIHKMHVLCLLYHAHRRNSWCNDRRVQSTLRKIVPESVLQSLVPNPELTQFSAAKRFVDAMNQMKICWSKRFKITAQGMYKPRWAELDAPARPLTDFDDLDDPMDKDDFRTAAQTLRGSQDVGAQLLCALLRGIGIDARLICSLQPLPFVSAAERTTPLKADQQKKTIEIDPFHQSPRSSQIRTPHTPVKSKKLSRLERVMGERHSVLHNTGVAPKKQKAFHVPYPVYWVETFNTAHQKWVPIDPHSTFTVNSPEKLEPPLSYMQNSLTYVIAFDEDYTAKDVTRRYARAYNAKTRKFRVESTVGGEKWWQRAMKFFRRSTVLDREQLEDAALARKEAAEGIPKNVQDFKGHPVYVLERHLKQNEVIYPLNQVGKVNCGTAMNPKMEPIFRRKNVHVVRSSDKWYRMGRDVKHGEQPLKHAKPKRNRRASIDPDVDPQDQDEAAGVGLYAEYQTEIFIPPPVIRGRVPRNAYGNLDLYVPSMCPAGGVHIRHKLAAKAARIVAVDYADAVTGFTFKGRHGTAVVQGIVVAQEYTDAVHSVIDGLEYQVEEAEAKARSAQSLQLWRRFLLGLRITQRVNAIEIDGEKGPDISLQDEISKEDRELEAQNMAGGFFPDEGYIQEPQSSNLKSSRDDYCYPLEPPERFDSEGKEHEEEEEGFTAKWNGEDQHHTLPINLDRGFSFESTILDSQEFRRPRRKSILADHDSLSFSSSEKEEEEHESTLSLREASPTTQQALLDALAKQYNVPTLATAAVDMGGGFIPEDAEQEIHLPAHPEAISEKQGEPINESVLFSKVSEEDEKPLSISEQKEGEYGGNDDDEDNKKKKKNDDDEEKDEEEEEEEEDTGSLLLEDPEDEDADPDWLIDAT